MYQIHNNYDLNELNTLHLTSIADQYVKLDNIDDLPQIMQYIKNTNLPLFILGGGSNIILPKHYVGLVLHNQLKGMSCCGYDDQTVLIKAMAGESWDDFVQYTLDNGGYGLENLSLIPGTVGASPIQNIGAYGVEVKDFIEYVEAYDTRVDKFICLANKDCDFSYRNSYFKLNRHLIVTAVVFRLNKVAKLNLKYADIGAHLVGTQSPSALDLRHVIIKIRQSKLPDPRDIGNVGSFFHNPLLAKNLVMQLKSVYPNMPIYEVADASMLKVSAGWLIDNLGLKGYKLGHVGTYEKQALVLVNHGGATTEDVLNFAKFIIDKVYAIYKIKLHIEPIIV